MSKLADRIRKASRPEPAPLGFAAAVSRATSPSMLVLIRLQHNDTAKANEAIERGADGVIAEGDPGKIKNLSANAVFGVNPENKSREGVAKARDAGADFVVLDAASDAGGLLEEKIGFVVRLPEGLDDVRLRVLGELDLDAVITPSPTLPLTLESLLEVRRVAGLVRTPLLTEVDPGIESGVLHALRESGVAAVVLSASAIGKLREVRERIDALPARGKRRDDQAEALVPAQATMAGHDHDDDFDDD